jgi:hypothetical protein
MRKCFIAECAKGLAISDRLANGLRSCRYVAKTEADSGGFQRRRVDTVVSESR